MNFIVKSFLKPKKEVLNIEVPKWKQYLFNVFYLIVFLSFILRLVYLQVLNYPKYLVKATENFKKKEYILPERGLILDKNNIPLVYNKPVFELVIDLNRYNRFKTYKGVSEILLPQEQNLIKAFKVSLDEDFIDYFNNELDYGKDYYVLFRFYEEEMFQKLTAHISTLEQELGTPLSLKVRSSTYRDYVASKATSLVLGYVNEVFPKDLEKDSWYTPNFVVGKTGLESYYEYYLRGEKGEKLKIYNSLAKKTKETVLKKPKKGASVYTTLDLKLQILSYALLEEKVTEVNAKGGAIVIQDAKTGGILALASYPSFDSNDFSRGITLTRYNQYIKDSKKPFINRAYALGYPPGSTFKIVTASGGLQDGLITPETLFNDPGVIRLGQFSYKTWKPGGHGTINVVDALKESSDTFFYVLGGGHKDFPQIKPLGVWGLYKWSKIFGFGELTGIDLPGEFSGVVPNPDWKEQNIGEKWYLGNTYHFAIGQGYLQATPLQVNLMTLAIANNGKILKPFLVEKIVDYKGKEVLKNTPKVLKDTKLSKQTLDTIKEGLIKAVQPGGTAYPLFNYPISVAGKTGTAEHGVKDEQGNLKTHAWFTAYAPVEDPQIVVTAFLEDGGGGSDNAVPLVKVIFDYYFNLK